MTEDRKDQVSRRQALRRIAAAGAVAWAVPTVQTINMSRAFAQTQTSPPTVCSWFRIGNTGTCGMPIDGYSCLSSESPIVDCSPLTGLTSTPSAAEWVVCLAAGYEVAEVALSSAGNCWSSTQHPSDHSLGLPAQDSSGSGTWSGWFMSQNCLHVPAPVDASGAPVGIDHIDVIACQASTLRSPSETPSPSESPPPSTTPPTGPTGPTTGATGPGETAEIPSPG